MGIHTPGRAESFEDGIVLDKVTTREEAIADMARFHDTSNEAVLKAFFNLRTQPCAGIKFEKAYSGQGGIDYIKMVGVDDNESQVWYSMIDMHSGQPIQKVS